MAYFVQLFAKNLQLGVIYFGVFKKKIDIFHFYLLEYSFHIAFHKTIICFIKGYRVSTAGSSDVA